MNPFKTIIVTLNASLDQFISQVENHEAVAESTLREVERAASRAKVQFKRMQGDQARLEGRIQELSRQRELWIGRARKLRTSSEEDALECVRRMKAVEREIELCSERRRTQEDLITQLSEQLRSVEERLCALRTKKRALTMKQAQADAVRILDRSDTDAASRAENIFDRWEACLESSLSPSPSSEQTTHDAFESKLIREEQHEDLKKTLDELTRS